MTKSLKRRQVLGLAASVGLLVGTQVIASPLVMATNLDALHRRGQLIVGIKENWRPLGFRDTSGQLVGLEIDIAHRLAATLLGDPAAVTLVPLANRDRLAAVLSGQVDLAIAGITATDVRRRLVTFSEPYYLDSTALITQNDQLTTLAQAAQATIAILQGSSAIATVRSLLPQAELVGMPSYHAAQEFLETHPAAAFAGDASVLTGWLQTDDRYRLVPALLSAEPLAIAMPKGLQHDALHRQVNLALTQWADEGWLLERLAYWQLP